MKEIVVYKFRVFDEIIKQKVMAVVWGFPGVTSVEGEGQLEVRGEFDKYEMTKELKKIDESVDIITVGPDEEKGPEVNKPPNGGDKRPIEKEEVNNPSAGSSNWAILRPYGLWDKAKGIGASAAEHALVLGAGAAEKALVIGAGAVGQAKVIGAGAFEQAKIIGAGAAEKIKKRREQEEQLRKIEEKNESDRRYFKKREEERKKAREMGQEPIQGGLTRDVMNSFTSSFSFTTGQTSVSTRDPRSTQTSKTGFHNPSKDRPP